MQFWIVSAAMTLVSVLPLGDDDSVSVSAALGEVDPVLGCSSGCAADRDATGTLVLVNYTGVLPKLAKGTCEDDPVDSCKIVKNCEMDRAGKFYASAGGVTYEVRKNGVLQGAVEDLPEGKKNAVKLISQGQAVACGDNWSLTFTWLDNQGVTKEKTWTWSCSACPP